MDNLSTSKKKKKKQEGAHDEGSEPVKNTY